MSSFGVNDRSSRTTRTGPDRAAGAAGPDQEDPDRDDHAQDEPLEHAEDEHGDQDHQGDHEAVVAQTPAPLHGRQVEEPEHGADHHRPQGRLGQVPEQRQQGHGGDHGEPGHQQRHQLGLGPPARSLAADWLAPPPVMKPWNRPDRTLAIPTARSSRSGSTVYRTLQG